MITTVTLNPAVDKTYHVNGFRCGHVNKACKVHITAGAKGINVSRVLNALNAQSTALGFAGGHVGKLLVDLLTKEKVLFDYISTAEETRLNAKILDLKTNEFTEINECGGAVTEAEFSALLDRLEEYLPQSPYIVLGGSIPVGMKEDVYYHIIKRISSSKIYLDCGGKLLFEAVKAAPYFVKPNLEEFGEMIQKDCKTLEQAALYADQVTRMGVNTLVITDGDKGAIAIRGGKVYEILVPHVEAKSTVGAGDSFLGGFVYGESCGADFITCLKMAASCSVAKVTCDSSIVPDKKDLLSYTDQVCVRQLRS